RAPRAGLTTGLLGRLGGAAEARLDGCPRPTIRGAEGGWSVAHFTCWLTGTGHSWRLPPSLSTPTSGAGNSEGPGPLPLRVRSGSFGVCGSGLLDHDGDGRGHLVVEADVGLVLTDVADRGGDLGPATVDLRTTGGDDRLGDVTGGHGAEQTSALTGPGRDGDRGSLQGRLGGLGVVLGLVGAGLAPGQDRVSLLLATLGPGGAQLAGQQVVAGVAVLDLDDVTGRAESGDRLGENELHQLLLVLMLSAPSWSTAAEP